MRNILVDTEEYERLLRIEKDQKRLVNETIEVTHDLSANNEVLKDVIKQLIKKLPNERHDYSGVAWCAGCGAVLYVSGDLTPRDPCKPDCILQKAKKIIGEKNGKK